MDSPENFMSGCKLGSLQHSQVLFGILSFLLQVRMEPENNLVQCHSQRVNVTFGIRNKLWRQFFRWHVWNCSLAALLLFEFWNQLGYSKVAVFVKFALDQYVWRLDILMNDSWIVQIQVPFSELEKEIKGLIFLDQSVAVPVFPFRECSAFTILLENVKIFFGLKMLFMSVD